MREPLANIIAQTKAMNRLKRDLDPHYATVSDDSGKNNSQPLNLLFVILMCYVLCR